MKIFHYDEKGFLIGSSEYEGKVAPDSCTHLHPPQGVPENRLRFSVRHNRWYDIGQDEGGQLAAMKAIVREKVTALRWKAETGGLLTPQGVVILTDTVDQNRIATSVQGMEEAGLDSIDFKAANGWVRLTLDELKGIMKLIVKHVEQCFSNEKRLHALVEGCTTIDELERLRIGVGWPENPPATEPVDDDWEAAFAPEEPEMPEEG